MNQLYRYHYCAEQHILSGGVRKVSGIVTSPVSVATPRAYEALVDAISQKPPLEPGATTLVTSLTLLDVVELP